MCCQIKEDVSLICGGGLQLFELSRPPTSVFVWTGPYTLMYRWSEQLYMWIFPLFVVGVDSGNTYFEKVSEELELIVKEIQFSPKEDCAPLPSAASVGDCSSSGDPLHQIWLAGNAYKHNTFHKRFWGILLYLLFKGYLTNVHTCLLRWWHYREDHQPAEATRRYYWSESKHFNPNSLDV